MALTKFTELAAWQRGQELLVICLKLLDDRWKNSRSAQFKPPKNLQP
jgi:hypothetical protein